MAVKTSIDLGELSGAEIEEFLSEHKIGLTPREALKIQNEILKRPPTLTELVVWGIQGSEHSSYKSSKNYLKSLPTEGKTVILGPKEDSGVAFFCEAGGRKYGLVLSHESHNHPSQVVPFEGAATGVGGIVRDIACMGAKVVGALDMLRFGDLAHNQTKLIAEGVVKGIGGYGNPLGVPNIGGDVFFDSSFQENCLVNVAAVGLIEADKIIHSYVPENAKNEPYDFILVGKPTDQSGFGGASFASSDLDEADEESNKGAVQEPNPFLERHLLASFYDLFAIFDADNLRPIIGLKDLGAGGVLCATVELAEAGGFGAEIDVKKIHVAEDNLPPSVILCSETQERFCFAVPQRLSEMVLRHFNEKWALPEVSAGARASVIGKVTTDGIYRAYYEGELVCNAAAQAITEGLTVERPVKKPRQNFSALELDWQQLNLKKLISDLIATDNLSSREVITENYDQSVQGNTFLERSWADAAVVRPLLDEEDLSLSEQQNAFAVGVGGSARLGRISPFRQAAQAVVSAVSKAAAVGARTVALTDCLCYGSPEVPEEMWEFTEGVRGIKQAAESLQLDGQLDPDKGSLPFVSGNVSLYNRSARSAVNPTVTICSYSVLGDASRARRNYWQQAGSKIVLLGELGESLAASELAALLGETGSGEQLGELDFPEIQRQIDFLIATSGDADLINAASSIEEGGLIYKLLEMSFKSNLGFKVDLVAFSNAQIFSEYQGFVLEVAPEKLSQLEKLASEYQVKLTTLGEVVDSGLATIQDRNLELDLAPLKQSWQSSLRKRLG